MSLALEPITLREAAAFTAAVHRHHAPRRAHRFSVGARRAGTRVGVAVASSPAAAGFSPDTIEIARVASDGARNVCSFLYGALCRAARSLGYSWAITYTRYDEPGTSLRAAGFFAAGWVPAREWTRTNRPRSATSEAVGRIRWERCL